MRMTQSIIVMWRIKQHADPAHRALLLLYIQLQWHWSLVTSVGEHLGVMNRNVIGHDGAVVFEPMELLLLFVIAVEL